MNIQLTRLERFVADNPDMTFEEMARQLNRTPGAMERAYERMRAKERKAELIRGECPKYSSGPRSNCGGGT